MPGQSGPGTQGGGKHTTPSSSKLLGLRPCSSSQSPAMCLTYALHHPGCPAQYPSAKEQILLVSSNPRATGDI